MIDKIIAFSIKNKFIIGLMTVGLIIGGFYSMMRVPIDALPDITNNQVMVITRAPNLGAEDIEKYITYPVELGVANLPYVSEIRSVSRFGLSVVTIVFEEDAGTYLPRQLISEALTEIKEEIPKGFGEPFMAPITTGLGEIYQYVLEVQPGYEDKYDAMKLRTIQDWIVKRQMAMLPGVVEVSSLGGKIKQYEVAIDPEKLKSMGLTVSDVFRALEKNNENSGGAYIEKYKQAIFIRGEGVMKSLKEIEETPITNINGKVVFVRDIARVGFGHAVRYGAFTKDGKGEAVGGIVLMLKGANSNEVIQAVKERIKLIQKSLPEGIVLKPFLERSKLISSTIATVTENLSLGALIVVFVLVLFLGSIRGGLIVASTIPLALLFAFIMMDIFDVWANLMSLGALDFGILIDGAVIIVESVIFYLHRKQFIGTRLKSALRDEIAYNSATKMMGSAFFGQLIILIVFIPVLTLQGVEGKMFIPMALTFGFAVLGVVVLCLTYIPMMSALFLQPPKNEKKTFGEKIIIALENSYKPVVEKALNNKAIILTGALGLLLLGGFLFSRMGAEFIPKLDEGDLAMQAFLKPGTSLSETIKSTTKIEKIILQNFPDEVESVQSRIGVSEVPTDPMPMDMADMIIVLHPKEQWKKASTKAELIEKIKEKVSVLPGINLVFTQPVEMRFNELLTGIREDIAIKIYGEDLDILARKAQEVAELIAGIEGIADIKTEATQGMPQISIRYNRYKLGIYNLDIETLNQIVAASFAGGYAGSIYEGEKKFDLVVRLDKKYRNDLESIRNLYIELPGGNQIPLREVADINYRPALMQISRDNTHRRIYVGINVRGRDIKSLVNEIQQVLDKKLKLPEGYYIRYGGAFENLERATERLLFVVPLALGLIFILVFFAIKSFAQTLMIYVAIPFAAVGGIFSLYLRDMPFSISAGVGFIVLFGVAVLNGLVLINSFNELKKTGKYSLDELIKAGAVRRIRPILLTASTDILGFLPMAISQSAGAEVQRPLATVVIGGMLSATFLTLLILPVLYKIVEGKNKPRISVNNTAILLGLFLLAGTLNAQNQRISLQDALNIAKKKYPAMKAASLQIEKQKAFKKNTYLPGTFTLFSAGEEIGNNESGVQTLVGVNISNFSPFAISSRKKLGDAYIRQASSQKDFTEQSLIRDVSLAWFNAAYYKQQQILWKSIDTLYQDFLKISEARYNAQDISQTEFLAASVKYREVQVNLRKVEKEYLTALIALNQYLQLPALTDLDTEAWKFPSPLENFQEDALKNNPLLNVYASRISVAEARKKVTKSNYAPQLNFNYGIQRISGVSGFYTWQAGISIPLGVLSGKNALQAAELNKQIAELQYQQKQLEIQTQYQQLLNQLQIQKKLVEYYYENVLPLAEKQILQTQLEYKLGNIDYLQFIKNLEAALRTKLDFLKQQYEYFKLLTYANYFLGKN